MPVFSLIVATCQCRIPSNKSHMKNLNLKRESRGPSITSLRSLSHPFQSRHPRDTSKSEEFSMLPHAYSPQSRIAQLLYIDHITSTTQSVDASRARMNGSRTLGSILTDESSNRSPNNVPPRLVIIRRISLALCHEATRITTTGNLM